eukprot:44787_1
MLPLQFNNEAIVATSIDLPPLHCHLVITTNPTRNKNKPKVSHNKEKDKDSDDDSDDDDDMNDNHGEDNFRNNHNHNNTNLRNKNTNNSNTSKYDYLGSYPNKMDGYYSVPSQSQIKKQLNRMDKKMDESNQLQNCKFEILMDSMQCMMDKINNNNSIGYLNVNNSHLNINNETLFD